jgi:hypothetical protein
MIGPIQWSCVEAIPTPQNRTDFGMNEQVNFWIDSTTWQDQDYYIDPYGNQTVVYDSMGTVTWTATGAATIYPLTGTSTLLTVNDLTQDSPVGVTVSVADSGTLGVDAPVPMGAGGNGRVPTGIQGVQLDQDLGVGTPSTCDPDTQNQIGARSLFWYQVTPAAVNFANTDFRENIPAIPLPPPYAAPVWPDGTEITSAADIVPFSVDNQTFGPPGNQVVQANMVHDRLTSGPYPKARLGDPPQAFGWFVPVPLEYFGGGAWNRITSTNSKDHWRDYQATLKARVGIDPGSGTVWGGLQGPWQ